MAEGEDEMERDKERRTTATDTDTAAGRLWARGGQHRRRNREEAHDNSQGRSDAPLEAELRGSLLGWAVVANDGGVQ